MKRRHRNRALRENDGGELVRHILSLFIENIEKHLKSAAATFRPANEIWRVQCPAQQRSARVKKGTEAAAGEAARAKAAAEVSSI